ncbi:HEAT repeat domain-containing protein [Streptomyces yanii]|uniref:HEAT repeat domain-containing protein n=1 Tax=Streptomyces yanii TaxID=78510 RepID=A0ABV5RHL6_9ACTN
MRLNVIFRDSIDPQLFAGFAEGQKWVFQGSYPATESAPAEMVWAAPTGVGLHLIEDEALDLIYLSIENYSIKGTSPDDVQSALNSVSEEFETISAQELIDLYYAEPDWNARVLTLTMIAAAAGEDFTPGICQVIKHGIRFEQPDVRKAAAIASMYAPWPDLKATIEAAARSDSDEQVRDLAAMSLLNFA